MSAYLFDTDTCVFRLRRMFGIDQRISQVHKRHRFVSEITVAELRFGAERCDQRNEQMLLVDAMYDEFTVLPITPAIRIFAAEKVRLWNIGQKIADFDLLIGATALYHGLILVTNNTRHFERMPSLRLENWMP
jgi:tRNA(fMet)-specific endonuclease VapC